MNLTDRETELLEGMIDRGEPLPPKYLLSRIADAREVGLIWQGETECEAWTGNFIFGNDTTRVVEVTG